MAPVANKHPKIVYLGALFAGRGIWSGRLIATIVVLSGSLSVLFMLFTFAHSNDCSFVRISVSLWTFFSCYSLFSVSPVDNHLSVNEGRILQNHLFSSSDNLESSSSFSQPSNFRFSLDLGKASCWCSLHLLQLLLNDVIKILKLIVINRTFQSVWRGLRRETIRRSIRRIRTPLSVRF